MLSAHLFFCLLYLPPPFTVPCKMVLARPDERKTCPYHCSLRLFTMVRRSSFGPIACWTFARTSSLVTKFINSTKDTSVKRIPPYPPSQVHSATQVCTGIRLNRFWIKIGHSCRQFRSLWLCPVPVERYYFPLLTLPFIHTHTHAHAHAHTRARTLSKQQTPKSESEQTRRPVNCKLKQNEA